MVKVETGVIRESLASKSFTSTFVSGVGVAEGVGVGLLTGSVEGGDADEEESKNGWERHDGVDAWLRGTVLLD